MQPSIIWPNGCQAAAAITIELDGEYIWYSIDPACYNKPKVTSLGTYGTNRGLERVLISLDRYGIKATFFVPGIMGEKHVDLIKHIADQGHEIALHGYEHENFGLLTPMQQREALERGMTALTKAMGKAPVGFRMPQGNCTPETLSIVQQMGLFYDCSMLDSDVPYRLCFPSGKLMEIPMSWESEDFTYFAFSFYPAFPESQSRMSSYGDVLQIWKDELAGYTRYGLCYIAKFDPQTIGTPGRIGMLDELIGAMKEQNLWIATCADIAAYCGDQPAR